MSMTIKREAVDRQEIDFSDVSTGVGCRRCTLARSCATSF